MPSRFCYTENPDCFHANIQGLRQQPAAVLTSRVQHSLVALSHGSKQRICKLFSLNGIINPTWEVINASSPVTVTSVFYTFTLPNNLKTVFLP